MIVVPKKAFLTRLFGKVKLSPRNKLLVISEDKKNYQEIGSQRSGRFLINDAECMFQSIFTEVILPTENIPHNVNRNSINFLSCYVSNLKFCYVVITNFI